MSAGLHFACRGLIALEVLFVIGVLVWQGVTAQGASEPMEPTMSPSSPTVGIAVLVDKTRDRFRDRRVIASFRRLGVATILVP